MQRYLYPYIYADCGDKIIVISGPRQSGKTTLSKSLNPDYLYFNYDHIIDRQALKLYQWKKDTDCLIFDEIHKMPQWKRWIKGYYDVNGIPPWIILTGSAQLESFTHMGDSLAGRYFHYRLHPLDIKEAVLQLALPHDHIFDRLMTWGGFPEPFLKNSSVFYKKWQRTHLDVILRQDLLDLYAIRSILKIETLVILLTGRVASPISHANIAQDLQVDSKTLLNWCALLEQFYLIFKVLPYHHNVARAILKEPKYYFFDIPRVRDFGARLENLVACALLKEVHFLQDTQGEPYELYYVRTKDGVEIDFLITLDGNPLALIEVKSTDETPSKAFAHFQKTLKAPYAFQLVATLDREFDTVQGVAVRQLSKFLAALDLAKLAANPADLTKVAEFPTQIIESTIKNLGGDG